MVQASPHGTNESIRTTKFQASLHSQQVKVRRNQNQISHTPLQRVINQIKIDAGQWTAHHQDPNS